MGRATAHVCCNEVANVIIKRLYKKVVRFLNAHDTTGWEKIANGFRERRGIRSVASIDGTHFAIRKPAGDALHNAYIYRKGFASIACQAVVNADGLFQSVSQYLASKNALLNCQSIYV